MAVLDGPFVASLCMIYYMALAGWSVALMRSLYMALRCCVASLPLDVSWCLELLCSLTCFSGVICASESSAHLRSKPHLIGARVLHGGLL